MLTFDEFKVRLEEMITEYLGEDGTVEYITNVKNNGTHREAFVLKGSDSKVSPCVYTEAMYDDYIDGLSMDEIMEIIKMVFEERVNVYDELFFADWNNVKRIITVAVINTEWNKESLERLIHRQFLDLSIICKCIVHEDEQRRASFNITREHTNNWGITEDELWEVALSNLKSEQFHMRNLWAVMNMFGDEERTNENDLFVLTNGLCKDGAKAILRPECIRELAEKMKSDLYVIPSSIHELLCMPVNEDFSVNGINRMIQEVNHTQVEKEDRLSNNVYLYSRDTGEVTIAQ